MSSAQLALAPHRDTAVGTQQWGHRRGPERGTAGAGGSRALKLSTGVLTMRVTLSCLLSLVPFPIALFMPFLLQGLSANRCQ